MCLESFLFSIKQNYQDHQCRETLLHNYDSEPNEFDLNTYTTITIATLQGRSQDLGGGGAKNFFFRFGNLHVAKRHAAHGEAMRIARGVRGHAPPRKFFKTMQFGAF